MEKDNTVISYYKKKKERLEALRVLVKLSPIDYLRVLNAKNQAEHIRNLTAKFYPNDSIDTDYTIANDLEYALRLNTFMRKSQKSFYDYQKIENECFGLEDYTIDYIDTFVEENKKEKRKVK